jgi:hypothetical protein
MAARLTTAIRSASRPRTLTRRRVARRHAPSRSPVYPLHTAYHAVEFLDNDGDIVAPSHGLAMEDTTGGLLTEIAIRPKANPAVSGVTGDIIFAAPIIKR